MNKTDPVPAIKKHILVEGDKEKCNKYGKHETGQKERSTTDLKTKANQGKQRMRMQGKVGLTFYTIKNYL